MANKVGPLIKEARTNAGLSQDALAKMIDGLSASDVGKAERGEKELSQDILKQIAKATGVTQKSLVEAAKASTYSTGSSKSSAKSSSKSSSTAAKTSSTSSKSSSKSSSTSSKSSSKSSSSSSKSSAKAKEEEFKLTATEKKLVELYRAADSDTKKTAIAVLKGETTGNSTEDLLNSLISGASSLFGNK